MEAPNHLKIKSLKKKWLICGGRHSIWEVAFAHSAVGGGNGGSAVPHVHLVSTQDFNFTTSDFALNCTFSVTSNKLFCSSCSFQNTSETSNSNLKHLHNLLARLLRFAFLTAVRMVTRHSHGSRFASACSPSYLPGVRDAQRFVPRTCTCYRCCRLYRQGLPEQHE